MPHKEILLWGERMPVSSSEVLQVKNEKFPLYHVQASDNTRALLMLCMSRVGSRHEHLERYIPKQLKEHGLEPMCRKQKGHMFLKSVKPVHRQLTDRFGKGNVGIVVFVNGKEPGDGLLALDEMHAKKGDTVQVIYKIAENA